MVSLGIGLTSNCNLNCAHCYRDQKHVYNLTLADVQKICNNLEIRSIGFGTGENGLNPEYFQIIDYIHSLNIKMTLASNGYTLSITPDEKLRYFKDVEVSIDFPDQDRQDQFRGKGNWHAVMQSIERCHRLGIRVSVLAVLMNLNYKDLGSIARLASCLDADFRVNVYQPMYTDKFMPSFEQYWDAYKDLFDQSEIISVTEPLVNTFLGLNDLKATPCGRQSLRVAPNGKLKACVYWPTSNLTINDLVEKRDAVFDSIDFLETRYTPAFCLSCKYVGNCGGGCAARRRLRGRLEDPDEYCPIARGRPISLTGRSSLVEKPLRTGSICTTIVRAA